MNATKVALVVVCVVYGLHFAVAGGGGTLSATSWLGRSVGGKISHHTPAERGAFVKNPRHALRLPAPREGSVGSEKEESGENGGHVVDGKGWIRASRASSGSSSGLRGVLYTWSDLASLGTFREWAFIKDCYARSYGYQAVWDTTPADLLEVEIMALMVRNQYLNIAGIPPSDSPLKAMTRLEKREWRYTRTILYDSVYEWVWSTRSGDNTPGLHAIFNKLDPTPALLDDFAHAVFEAREGKDGRHTLEAAESVVLTMGQDVLDALEEIVAFAPVLQATLERETSYVHDALAQGQDVEEINFRKVVGALIDKVQRRTRALERLIEFILLPKLDSIRVKHKVREATVAAEVAKARAEFEEKGYPTRGRVGNALLAADEEANVQARVRAKKRLEAKLEAEREEREARGKGMKEFERMVERGWRHEDMAVQGSYPVPVKIPLGPGAGKSGGSWYSLGPQWSTLANMLRFFDDPEIDFIWMTGGDQYLQRTDVDIAELLELAGPDKDVVVMDAPHWPESRSKSYGFGGILVRNTEWARDFILRMYAKRWRFYLWDDNTALTETLLEVLSEENVAAAAAAEAAGAEGHGQQGEEYDEKVSCSKFAELLLPYGMHNEYSQFGLSGKVVGDYGKCFFDQLDRLAGPYGNRAPNSKIYFHNMLTNSINLNCWSALREDPRMDLSWCMTVHFNGLGPMRKPFVWATSACNNVTRYTTSCSDYVFALYGEECQPEQDHLIQ